MFHQLCREYLGSNFTPSKPLLYIAVVYDYDAKEGEVVINKYAKNSLRVICIPQRNIRQL